MAGYRRLCWVGLAGVVLAGAASFPVSLVVGQQPPPPPPQPKAAAAARVKALAAQKVILQPGGVVQPGFPEMPGKQPVAGSDKLYSAITLVTEPKYKAFITAAQDCIKDKVWP